ncbi:hypothetical protein ACIQWL_38960 [Streptomyces mirabilis]|uniref:hypothetical protein n=1 Tax=Streptomyces mirabilis TaxID=68239 RepID=UPI0033FB6D1B
MPASMLGVLVVTAVVMQLGRGETMTVNPAGMKAQGIDPDNVGEFSLGLTLEYGKPGLRPLVGEIRILLQGTALWWWAGVLLLTLVAQMVTPATGVTRFLLPLAWIWPVLIWSRLGTQRHESGVEAILGAYPAARSRMAAEWGAGFLLTVVAGMGPAVRMVTGSDTQGLVHWFLGALFISSFALVLGTLSRTHRLFQFAYLPLWYGTGNGIAA